MTISMDKKYKTRDGRDVRLLCVDKPGNFPVVVVIGKAVFTYTENGQYDLGSTSYADLVEVPKEYFRTIGILEAGSTQPFHVGAIVTESKEELRQDLEENVANGRYKYVAVTNEAGDLLRIEEF